MSGDGPFERDEDLRKLLRPGARTTPEHDDAVLAAARTFTDETPVVRPSRRRRLRLVIPLAVLVGLAAITVGLYARFGGPLKDGSPLRSLSNAPSEAITPANGTVLSEPPAQFHWPAQAGAKAYRVILRDASAEVVWRSDAVRVNRASLDARHAATLATRTYYWSVEVDGAATTRQLGPFWFRVE